MFEGTGKGLSNGNCVQNLYQRSTTATSRASSQELKQVKFVLLWTRCDAAFVYHS